MPSDWRFAVLQRAASSCVNLDLPWNPAVFGQRIGGIYRLGKRRPIDVYKDLPSWIDEGGPGLEQRGVPTVTYLTIRQMKVLGADYGGVDKVKMSTIQNVRAVIELNVQLAQGVNIDAAAMKTHSVQYGETAIVQSGHKIVPTSAKVGGQVWETPLNEMLHHYETRGGTQPPDPAVVAKHDALIAKFGQGTVKRETVVKWNYDIEFEVTPFEGQTQ